MAVQYLNSKNVDGQSFGQSSTDKISFYGATPIVRPAVIATIATNDTTTNISVAVNAIITALRNLGLNASS